MIKSENGVMITKEEFEKLTKKWKILLNGLFELSSEITPKIAFHDDEILRDVYGKLSPLFSTLQSNASDLTMSVIMDELFD